ncbi:hypothetical protein [Streptomyces sp. NPDC051211]|uniref:hypothetical protein n=1 Tax=Streptomyces sp. NPDC051211 TaxID=3154643 RepID=UPI0034506FCF
MRTAYLEGRSIAALARDHDVSCGASVPPSRTWRARRALDQGITVRRGQGYTLRVTAVLAVHWRLLDLCQVLDGTAALPAQARPAASTRPRQRTPGCQPASS